MSQISRLDCEALLEQLLTSCKANVQTVENIAKRIRQSRSWDKLHANVRCQLMEFLDNQIQQSQSLKTKLCSSIVAQTSCADGAELAAEDLGTVSSCSVVTNGQIGVDSSKDNLNSDDDESCDLVDSDESGVAESCDKQKTSNVATAASRKSKRNTHSTITKNFALASLTLDQPARISSEHAKKVTAPTQDSVSSSPNLLDSMETNDVSRPLNDSSEDLLSHNISDAAVASNDSCLKDDESQSKSMAGDCIDIEIEEDCSIKPKETLLTYDLKSVKVVCERLDPAVCAIVGEDLAEELSNKTEPNGKKPRVFKEAEDLLNESIESGSVSRHLRTRKRGGVARPRILDSDDENAKENGDSSSAVLETSSSDSDENSTANASSAVESDDDNFKSSDDDFRTSKQKGKSSTTSKKKTKRNTHADRKGKRKRVQIKDSSSGEGSDEESSGKHAEESEATSRRKIRKIIGEDKLSQDTKLAEEAEAERVKRLAERQKLYNDLAASSGAVVVAEGECSTKVTKVVLERDATTTDVILEVHPKIVQMLKPHQVDGIQFLFDSTIESVRKANELGSGCILAHCMGLGKTLQVIAYVHTVLSCKRLKLRTCLVIAPLNTVLNWVAEFDKWLDDFDSKFVQKVYQMSDLKRVYDRVELLEEWQQEGGVMILGYEQFRNLVNCANVKKKKLKETIVQCLVDPGPDIVICDEGHMLKNDSTAVSKACNRIRTRRRVCLTGTPLQNNLIEYHTMVSFVKPSLLGTTKEFRNRFANPIKQGQCSDSTPYDVRIMKRRAHVLHDLLSGCVQRKDYTCLLKFLPPKYEFILNVRLSEKQCALYQLYLDEVVGDTHADALKARKSLFTDFQMLQRVWTHPYALLMQQEEADKRAIRAEMRDFITDGEDTTESSSAEEEANRSNNGDADEIKRRKNCAKSRPRAVDKGESSSDEGSDVEEIEVVKQYATRTRGGEANPTVDEGAEVGGSKSASPALRQQWWSELVDIKEDQKCLDLSGKLRLLFEIIKKCESIGDKLLVFSQSLISLALIERFLRQSDEEGWVGSKESFASLVGERWRWQLGVDYLRMDGSTSVERRREYAEQFNDSSNMRCRLFLISTRAGGLGINLVGANRVVIFDMSWNPSHDIQSIFRVYRFGQSKPVYVYRFVAQGTMEEKIYDRQVTKQSLSARVVDEQQVERHFTSADLEALYAFTPEEFSVKKRDTPNFPKDRLLADLMTSAERSGISAFHEHDSLLENITEEQLTEDERKAAWEEYENVKRGRTAAWNSMNSMGLPDTLDVNNQLQRLTAYGQQLINLSGQNVEMNMHDVVEKLKAMDEFKVSPMLLLQKVRGIIAQLQSFIPQLGPSAQQPNNAGFFNGAVPPHYGLVPPNPFGYPSASNYQPRNF